VYVSVFFVEVLNTNQPKISRHLAYLRKAGVVSARRDGKWIHYRIVEPPDEHAANIFREVRTWLKNDPDMAKRPAPGSHRSADATATPCAASKGGRGPLVWSPKSRM
jgi:hypothetical protein